MSDDQYNAGDDFADEPTDPGRVAPTAQPGAANPMNNLGFRPQTGAFGAVGGDPNQAPPQQGNQPNPFGNPGSTPNYSQSGSQASFQGSNPGMGSGGFPPPNTTGSFAPNTGEFAQPGHTGAMSGVANAPGQAQQHTFAPGQPSPTGSGGFAPPMTGGFQAVGQTPTGQQPAVGAPPVAPATGQFQNVPGATGTFQAPVGQPLQIGDYVEEAPEPTIKVRATFGLGGLLAGAIVGLALGLMNSLFEGVSILDGLSVTLQISLWFGGTIGLICAWKPDKVWETLEGYGFFD